MRILNVHEPSAAYSDWVTLLSFLTIAKHSSWETNFRNWPSAPHIKANLSEGMVVMPRAARLSSWDHVRVSNKLDENVLDLYLQLSCPSEGEDPYLEGLPSTLSRVEAAPHRLVVSYLSIVWKARRTRSEA